MPAAQFVEKVFFDKLEDFEKVCKKPHFRPEAVYRYCEREKRRLICNIIIIKSYLTVPVFYMF